MKRHKEFEDLAEALALGALNAADTAHFVRHLESGCAKCQQQVAELQRVSRALAWTPEPATPPADLKERLMQSLARMETNLKAAATPGSPFSFIRAHEGTWQELAPGVTAKELFAKSTIGSSTVLVRMAAGTTYPEHRHDYIEELFVLEGDCYCAGECLGPGDYHRAESGSIHGVTFTERGCMMVLHTSRLIAEKT